MFGITKADLTSADFLLDGAAAAEAPAVDKAIVLEPVEVLDPVDVVEKPVVSDDDGFVFVDKHVVSEDLLGFGGVDGDFVQEAGYALIDQDVMADFLAQAQAEFDFNTDVDAHHEFGIDAELNHHDYFTDFFSIV